jgi:predicted RNase H-like HicB family nuclease
MKGYQVEVEIKPWEEGAYLVEAPALQGCWCVIKSRQTVGKALEDIRDVVEMALAARKKAGEPLPPEVKSAMNGAAALRLTVTVGGQ